MNAAALDTPLSDDERIVAALLARGRLKEADLGRARRLQDETGGDLLSLLSRLGLVSERDHAETAAEVLGLPLVTAKDMPDVPPESVALSLRFLKQFHVCPVGEDETHVDLLMADPQDAYAREAVRLATGRDVRVRVALRSEISDLVERYYGQGRSAMGAIVENADGEAAFGGFDVDVRCAAVNGAGNNLVHQADDGGFAGQILEMFDKFVVIPAVGLGFVFAGLFA